MSEQQKNTDIFIFQTTISRQKHRYWTSPPLPPSFNGKFHYHSIMTLSSTTLSIFSILTIRGRGRLAKLEFLQSCNEIHFLSLEERGERRDTHEVSVGVLFTGPGLLMMQWRPARLRLAHDVYCSESESWWVVMATSVSVLTLGSPTMYNNVFWASDHGLDPPPVSMYHVTDL